jgi:hypothetical protein
MLSDSIVAATLPPASWRNLRRLTAGISTTYLTSTGDARTPPFFEQFAPDRPSQHRRHFCSQRRDRDATRTSITSIPICRSDGRCRSLHSLPLPRGRRRRRTGVGAKVGGLGAAVVARVQSNSTRARSRRVPQACPDLRSGWHQPRPCATRCDHGQRGMKSQRSASSAYEDAITHRFMGCGALFTYLSHERISRVGSGQDRPA